MDYKELVGRCRANLRKHGGATTADVAALCDAVEALEKELQDERGLGKKFDPTIEYEAPCVCGHPYYRHFDTYDNMAAVGCKYCGCFEFTHTASSPAPTASTPTPAAPSDA